MPPPLNAQIVGEIRAEMGRQRRQVGDLAEHMGVSRRTVSAILSGKRILDLGDLESIAAFLGVQPLELAERGAS